MTESQTLSIDIARGWREVYDQIWQPESFAKWAAGLSQSDLRRDGDTWKGRGSAGPVTIHFTSYNEYGVMDHRVSVGNDTVYVPLRVVANSAGCTIELTLFRPPGMSDDAYERDADAVRNDLLALKRLVSSDGS